jgi:hypothetical protein
MFFWSFFFCYIFVGYQNQGEKASAHIYALCILTLLLTVNVLSALFVMPSFTSLDIHDSKMIVIGIFAVLFSANGIYSLRRKAYLGMVEKYRLMGVGDKKRLRTWFWIYFSASVLVMTVVLI